MNFDEVQAKRHREREAEFGSRPFTFRGEEFFVRAVTGYPQIKRVSALSETSSGVETFDAIEDSVLSMIDPGNDAHARFLKTTGQVEFPVTFDDLIELQGWLLQETSGRPPTEPTSSVDTPPGTGTSSTDPSSNGQDEASTT